MNTYIQEKKQQRASFSRIHVAIQKYPYFPSKPSCPVAFSGVAESEWFSPFGVKQVSDLLVVNLHVGDFHREALALLRLLHRPAEQGAAEARNQARLLHGAHHGVGLART